MDQISREFVLEAADFEAYFRELQVRMGVPKQANFRAIASGLVISLFTIGVIHLSIPGGVAASGWLGWTAMMVGLFWYSVRRSLARNAYKWSIKMAKNQNPRRVQVGKEAIEIESGGIFSRINWAAVQSYSLRTTYLLAWISEDQGILFPKHGFKDDWDQLQSLFVEMCG